MKRLKGNKAISIAISLLLALQLMPLDVAFAATGIGAGDTKDLTGTNYLLIHDTSGTNPTGIIIKDGTTTLTPDGSGNYSDVPTGATLELNLGFNLSDGDGTNFYVYDGSEYFTFQLPKGITFSSATLVGGDVPSSGSPTIAKWSIDANDVLNVQFTDKIERKSGIWGYIKMTGTFDSMASGGTDTQIKLGSQTITINRNPTDPLPPVGEINLGKTGAYDPSTNQITWTVTVAPTVSTDDIVGYKLVDTYSGFQTYVPNSFKVGTATIPDANIGNGASPITYTFPTNTKGTQVITYRTSPSGAFDYSTQFKNTAELKTAANVLVKSAEKTITLGTIIKKEGTNIQPDGTGIIDWTVTVTLPQASDGGSYLLPKAKIIDVMDSRLGLITSDAAAHPIKISFDGGNTYTAVSSGSGDGLYNVAGSTLTYKFPANQPYTGTTTVFKYSTKVTDWNTDMMSNNPISFTNNASFEWETNPNGTGTGGSPVSIGTGTVTKTAGGGGLVSKSLASGWASSSSYDRTSTNSGDYIKWKIVVNGNKVALNNASITDTVAARHDLVISSTYPLTVKKNSEVAETYDSAKTNTNGELKNISTSSFTFDFPTNITDTYTIEYYTKLNDTGRESMYKGTNKVSASETFQNDVALYYTGGNANSSATKTYTLEMLNKSVATAYNIGDHTVRWRLVVNRNMLPMTSSSITDTLETGMVFLIDAAHPLTITAKDNTKATATHSLEAAGTISDASKPLLDTTKLTGATNDSSFTLAFPTPTSTSSEFTIYYWTKVTDDRLKDTAAAFWTGTNKQHTFANTVNLVTGKGDVSTTSTVAARNPVISKTHDYNASNPYEIINWTAVVNPAQIEINNGVVTDVLNGNLELVAGSVKLNSTNINASGQPTGTETTVPLTKDGTADGTNASYTYSGKTLKVNLPTATSKAYILRFQTTIVDDTITAAFTNTIDLSAGSTIGAGTSTSVNIHEVTAIGGMYSNSITVQKTDGLATNLAGAKFQLLNKNGNPVKRMDGGTLKDIIVSTDSNGKAVFTNLPSWVFQVKEVDPPAGYLIDNTAKMAVNGGSAINGDVTVSATNTLGLTTVKINKTGAGGVPLNGGTFSLTGKDYKNGDVEKYGTNVNGTVTFADVPIGTGQYTIKEVTAPDGHQVSTEEIKVTVGYNGAKTAVNITYPSDVTIENAPIAATSTQVSFKKTDLNGNAINLSTLGGAFVLKGTDYKNNSVNKTATVSADGTVSFSDVTISSGSYQIFETTTPAGYLNPNAAPATTPILDVTVAYNSGNTGLDATITKHGGGAADTNVSGKIIFKNTPAVGDITFQKNSSADPSVKINGGNFKISGTTIADVLYEAYAAAVNGVVTFKDVPVVKNGTSYTITEVTAPPGYLLTTVTLTGKVEYTDATKTAVIVTNPATNLKNDPAPFVANTKVFVLKTDKDGKKLAGAYFTLYDSNGNALATAASGNDGIALFTNIPIKKSYTIKEISAPAGYELSTQILSFSLSDEEPLSFTFVNEKKADKLGSINIIKTDESGKALSGAEFTLYDANGKAVGSAITKADGTAEFSNVPVGSYTVTETLAPIGYVADSGSASVKITDGAVVSLTFVNKKDSVSFAGKLQIAKVDKDYHPLEGAEFTLYDKDKNVIGKAVSGSDGMVNFEGLAPGKYSVKETAAPEGYKLFSGSMEFQISAAGSLKAYTLKNTKISDDGQDVAGWADDNGGNGGSLPKTGGIPGTLFMLLAGLCLLILGLIVEKPKSNQKKHRL